DGLSSDYCAIALGGRQPSRNCHIAGCRFGLDLDNITVRGFHRHIAGFGGATDGLVVGVAAGSAEPRAEFNVFISAFVLIELGGSGSRAQLSGNFFNVYPDGLHDFNVDGGGDPGRNIEALLEFGSGPSTIIGTDGDGVNDAEERNVFGGVTVANDNNVMEIYGTIAPTNFVVAGNYVGVGVDGTTVFTNGGRYLKFMDFNKVGVLRVGADFDGVSDAIEGNLISWNHPFTTLYGNPPDPGTAFGGDWAFLTPKVGAR